MTTTVRDVVDERASVICCDSTIHRSFKTNHTEIRIRVNIKTSYMNV
jgi:hypothetical protein